MHPRAGEGFLFVLVALKTAIKKRKESCAKLDYVLHAVSSTVFFFVVVLMGKSKGNPLALCSGYL